jgi:hypothetical protein
LSKKSHDRVERYRRRRRRREAAIAVSRPPLPERLYSYTTCCCRCAEAVAAAEASGSAWLLAAWQPEEMILFTAANICGDPECRTDHAAHAGERLAQVWQDARRGRVRCLASAGCAFQVGGSRETTAAVVGRLFPPGNHGS